MQSISIIDRMITLRQLRYLAALAQHRHFGRAADACGVTQPALSMQIRDLERELGIALVERRPNDIMLTDLGAEVARHAEQVLAAARDLEDFARHRGRVLSGRLHLGMIPTLAPYVLPRVLPLLHQRFPDLRIELRETQTRVLIDELTRGALDAAMLALPVTEPGLETIRLFDDAFVLAVPATDPRPETTRVRPDDIEPPQLILLEEGHCLRDQALALCASAHGSPEVSLGATSLATVMQMVANGYGVTLVPEVAADAEAHDERVKLLRFAEPQPGRTIGLAWRRTSPRRKDFEALAEIVTQVLGSVHALHARKAS